MCRDAAGGSVARPIGPRDSTRSRPLAAASRPNLSAASRRACSPATLCRQSASFPTEFVLNPSLTPMQSAETHGESDSVVDNAIRGAHYHLIEIIILDSKIAPTLYLDVHNQALKPPPPSPGFLFNGVR